MTLEEQLTSEIQMMMGATFDAWEFEGAVLPDAGELARSAKLPAQGIGRKLAEAVTRTRNLDEQKWQELVTEATRNAFMELPDGLLVKLAENNTFSEAVTTATARIVAPAGSAWAQSVEDARYAALRQKLIACGCTPANADAQIRNLKNGLNQ